MATIVVGADGSEGAKQALAFAADEAALRKAKLRIVSIWEIPAGVFAAGMAPPLDPATFETFGKRAQGLADEAAAAVKERHPDVECAPVAVQGQPAAVLLDEATSAELMVVGNRGLGGFAV